MVIEGQVNWSIKPRDKISIIPIGTREVQSTIDFPLLKTLVDPGFGAHLDNVQFPTPWPRDSREIVAQHPKGRPQTIGGIREFDPRFEGAVFEGESSLGEHSCGSERVSEITLSARLNHEVSVRNVRILVAGGVIFKLAIAKTPSTNVISPRI